MHFDVRLRPRSALFLRMSNVDVFMYGCKSVHTNE